MEHTHTADRALRRRWWTWLAIVVGVSVSLGVASALLGDLLGLGPPVLWVILWGVAFPYLLLLRPGQGRGVGLDTLPGSPALVRTVILDVRSTGRRLVQTAVPLAATLLAMAGLASWLRGDAAAQPWALPALLVGATLVVTSLLVPITWEETYRGQRIRFQNHPCLAERLFIDGACVDRGGLGLEMTLRGAIAAGEGAGTRIVATSHAGLLTFTCRIVAESDASV